MARKKKKTTKRQTNGWFDNPVRNGLGIFLLGFLLYANTLFHDFTLDDAIVITDNEFTQGGFAGLKDIFTKDTFHGFFGEAGKDKLVSGGRYRPFTLAMFAVEKSIFGNNPFLHHLINVLLYSLLGVLVFFFTKLIMPPKSSNLNVTLMALGASVLFVAHPIHTEAVANIKGRDEIMAMLGSMAATYLIFRKTDNNLALRDYLLASLLFLIALLSKENAITFVGVVPILAWVLKRNLIKTSLPFLITAILFLLIRTAVIGFDTGAVPSGELMNNPYLKIENGSYVPFTSSEKFATIFHTLWKYIQLLIVPYPLTHDYYPNHIDLKTFSNITSILGILSYLGLLIISVIGLTKRKIWAFFTAYYLVTISIVSNIVFPIGTHMSERFIFMPSYAFCTLLSYFLFRFNRKLAMIFIGVLLAAYGYLTMTRNMVWKDNYTLFTTDAMTSVRSAKVNNAAGGAISDRVKDLPESEERSQLITKGHMHLSQALKEHPKYKNAYLLKGNMFFFEGQYEEAIKMYDQSLRLDPYFQDALRNKFLALRAAGRYYGEELNNLQEAARYLTLALEMEPNDFETNRLLGTCYGIMGNHQLALKYFQKCAQLQPNNAAIFVNLAKAYEFVGDEENARQAAEKAASLQSSQRAPQ